MLEHIGEMATDVGAFLLKACTTGKPVLAFLGAAISYVLFPSQIYVSALIGVGGAMVLDILTKYYQLCRPYGMNLKVAIEKGAVSSDSFYKGSVKKVISFLVVAILCGLSVRVSPIAGVATFLSSLAYSLMFLRECQSCLENLIQAGHTETFILNIDKKVVDKCDELLNSGTVQTYTCDCKLKDNETKG